MKKSTQQSDNTVSDSYLLFIERDDKLPLMLNGIGFFEHEWYVKICNNYGIVSYISVNDHLDCLTNQIITRKDLFDHIILPKEQENEDGSFDVYWRIIDKRNLYLLEPLQKDYYDKDRNPKSFCCMDCFEAESVPDVFDYDWSFESESIDDPYHERGLNSAPRAADGGNYFNFYSRFL